MSTEFRWLRPMGTHDPMQSPQVLQWRLVVNQDAFGGFTATNWQTVPIVLATFDDYAAAKREQFQ